MGALTALPFAMLLVNLPTKLDFGPFRPRLQILSVLFWGVIGDRDADLLTHLETRGVSTLLGGLDTGSLQGSGLIRPGLDRGLRAEGVDTGRGPLCLLQSSGFSN